MPLIYDPNKHIFIKKEYKKYSGNLISAATLQCSTESPVQTFWINHFINSEQYSASLFSFDTPSYYTQGGTLNYYNQDYWSIFTNVYRPFIKFIFTANTCNFGTGTTVKHNIYKLPYDKYLEYASETIRKNVEKNKDYKIEDIEETFTDSGGNSSTTLTTKKTSLFTATEKLTPKLFPETVSDFEMLSNENYKNIEKYLTIPILTITAATSAITTNVYNLNLEEYQKAKGDFQYQLFEDYGQYFITTQFEFKRERGTGLCDFYQLGENNNLISETYQKYYDETTSINNYTITAGTFSGFTVCGNFFTYFLMPNKPKWENPYVDGVLDTFSPTFYWSHVDDGDNYLFQIVYESGDSKSFSGTVYSYPVEKESSNLSTEEMLNLPTGDWSITQKTTDVVRKISIPLLRDKIFWYRIGNVKELTNIFGVNQKVVTFSDIMSATTSSKSYNGYIYVQADSPYVEEISDLTYPGYLDDSIPIQYTLSGTISGSIVTGATTQLIYPNSSYITQITDSVGNYLFTGLESGNYILNTFYRGYKQDSKNIIISGNTLLNIKLKLMWENNYDTWGKLANENYYI